MVGSLEQVHLVSQNLAAKAYDLGLAARYLTEAEAVIQASSNENSIRHALISLFTLRQSIQEHGDLSHQRVQNTASFQLGLREYNKAVACLASKLSNTNRSSLASALYCCQLFVSIEATQKNYVQAIRHFTSGLRIMYDNRVRPGFDQTGNFIPSQYSELPVIDTFVIKLFSSGCPVDVRAAGINSDLRQLTQHTNPPEGFTAWSVEEMTAYFRRRLAGLGFAVLDYLTRFSAVAFVDQALILNQEKRELLRRLESWRTNIICLPLRAHGPSIPWHHAGYMSLLYCVLNVVLKCSLSSFAGSIDVFQVEFQKLNAAAAFIGALVARKTPAAANITQGEQTNTATSTYIMQNPFTII
jgi:hypothetical protein